MSTKNKLTRTTQQLTHRAALAILQACVDHAELLQCPPVNIVIATRSGQIIASIAMDESYFLSIETARNKALTAASHKIDTRELPEAIAKELAVASGGKITAMAGGVPIWFRGECIGGVGIGGASDDDDIAIATAGIHAVQGSISREESLNVQDYYATSSHQG
jgi:glc operon protein GlcG